MQMIVKDWLVISIYRLRTNSIQKSCDEGAQNMHFCCRGGRALFRTFNGFPGRYRISALEKGVRTSDVMCIASFCATFAAP